MPVQVNIFLLLFGALQGIFLSAILLQKKVHKAGYSYLVVYLAVMVIQVTLKVMSKAWLLDNLQPLYTFSYYFPLLYGPLLYFFISHLLHHKHTGAYSYLHFLPFAAAGFFIALTNFHIGNSPVVDVFFSPAGRLVAELLSVCIYHALAYRNWQKQQQSLKENYSDLTWLRSAWIKKFIGISFIVCILITIVIYLMFSWYPFNQDIRFGFIAFAVFIYWISYSAWSQPQLFVTTQGLKQETKEISIATPMTLYKAAKKYSNSGLSVLEEQRILMNLDELVDRQRLFLEPDLTIDKLAEKIGCSKHHLSQVLNTGLQKSFYDYINYYRVEEAKILLVDEEKANHKIASIAYDSGFNSLSTFNEVFKKITGITPSLYRKQPMLLPRKQRV